MPKIIVESGMVFNLGGYIVERKANLPCVDVVLGNPLKNDIKISAPAYSQEMIDEYEKSGMIIEYIKKGDSLKETLERVKKRVDKILEE